MRKGMTSYKTVLGKKFLFIIAALSLSSILQLGVDAISHQSSSKNHKFNGIFRSSPPYLAVLTEPDAVSSTERREETLRALKSAICNEGGRDNGASINTHRIVDLISIRVDDEHSSLDNLKCLLLGVKEICNSVELLSRRPIVVLNINNISYVEMALPYVDGVHVKECNWEDLVKIRNEVGPDVVLGSSCHSVASAVRAANCGVDYLFVGTCFRTQSHPEKNENDLEGPGLVLQIREELKLLGFEDILCLAIGGINMENCKIPVSSKYKADGVAAIRSVMSVLDPGEAAFQIKKTMLDNIP